MSVGEVYILSNPSMPGLIKIGKTCKSCKERAISLYTTGVPEPFRIEYYTTVPNASAFERELHVILHEFRPRRDREFFRIGLLAALKLIHTYKSNILWQTTAGSVISLKNPFEKFMDDYNEVSAEVAKFEKIMTENEWYPRDVCYKGHLKNKMDFEINIKRELQMITDGLEHRQKAIVDNLSYVESDDLNMIEIMDDIKTKLANMKRRWGKTQIDPSACMCRRCGFP